jgi:hypothetical protein
MPYPIDDNMWQACLQCLLIEAKECLCAINECLNKIIQLKDIDIIDEWKFKLLKNVPKYKMESIASQIISQYELQVDVAAFMDKNFEKIIDKISIAKLSNTEQIDGYVKKCIEDIIFSPGSIPCPITGDDIIKEFKVVGKDIGKLRKEALDIFGNNPYLKKDELIEELKKKYSFLKNI